MIQARVHGDFKNTYAFLNRIIKLDFDASLKKYGEEGVEALKEVTPVRTGKTRDSWSYEIIKAPGKVSIFWTNSNIQDGSNIAVILDYGHATKNGGYVKGRHFISPAIQPVFDKIADSAWKEVFKN